MIDAVDIVRFVGPRPFGRAKLSLGADSVSDLAWDPDRQVATAAVQGSVPVPYRVHVDMVPGREDFSRPSRSSCTCPLGGDCKHVAAVLLQLAARAVQERARAAASAPAEPEPGDDWKRTVARLSGADAPTVEHMTPLALQFELRDLVSGRLAARAGAPSAASDAGTRRVRLGVRPVTRSGAGNWVRGSLTWGSLPYSANRLRLDQAQHDWFGQFAALHRSVRGLYTPGEADWLFLDDFASPLLWPLLRQADRLGITLVTAAHKRAADGSDVALAHEARLVIDATRAEDAALRLTAGVVVDGRPIPAGSAGTIGTHGVYAFRQSPALAVTLAPTPSPIGEDQRRMLVRREAIIVPSGEVEEFVRDFSPRLRGSVDVVSSDGTIQLPDRTPARLTLTATFSQEDRVRLEWRWHVDGRRDLVTAHGPLPDLSEVHEPAGADGEAQPWSAAESWQDVTLTGVDTAAFAVETLPLLQRRDDLDVLVLGDRPNYRELTEPPKLTITTMESEKRDWFDLGFLVTVEGRTVPFAQLLAALANRQPKLKLVDHSYLSLAHPAFDRLKALIEEARDLTEWEPSAGLQISPYQAGLWSEFDQLADESVQAARWKETVGGLLRFADREAVGGAAVHEVPVPASVRAELRPYQQEGFAWLTFLREHGLGGVLADDMGLGKTLQTLAFVQHAQETAPRRPFLVVAPTSVVSNWVAESARFTPGLVTRAITATSLKRSRLVEEAADGADIVVTSYALFRLDAAAYREQAWAGLILDEAQFVKNPQSQAHQLAADLPAPFKLAITGTPLENGLTDLWALFHIVAPGLLSSLTRFGEDYVKPLGSPDLVGAAREERMDRLRRRIRPLMLRRTKESVAADLPPKQEQVLQVELDPAHRTLYDTVLHRERMKVLDLLDDLDRNRMIVFRSLTLLRMLSLAPSLVDPAHRGIPSAKVSLLLSELAQLQAEGRRALVFSQFTSFLRLVGERLEAEGVAYEYLDGSTRRRADVIDRFRDGDAPVFLISLKAGGFGLNLTEADTVFILDPWWNPAAESQAIDRTHRIGQTSSVNVYRLIADDTIEEKVLALAARKAELFDAMIDDDETFAGALTAEDVRGLLEA